MLIWPAGSPKRGNTRRTGPARAAVPRPRGRWRRRRGRRHSPPRRHERGRGRIRSERVPQRGWAAISPAAHAPAPSRSTPERPRTRSASSTATAAQASAGASAGLEERLERMGRGCREEPCQWARGRTASGAPKRRILPVITSPMRTPEAGGGESRAAREWTRARRSRRRPARGRSCRAGVPVSGATRGGPRGEAGTAWALRRPRSQARCPDGRPPATEPGAQPITLRSQPTRGSGPWRPRQPRRGDRREGGVRAERDRQASTSTPADAPATTRIGKRGGAAHGVEGDTPGRASPGSEMTRVLRRKPRRSSRARSVAASRAPPGRPRRTALAPRRQRGAQHLGRRPPRRVDVERVVDRLAEAQRQVAALGASEGSGRPSRRAVAAGPAAVSGWCPSSPRRA